MISFIYFILPSKNITKNEIIFVSNTFIKLLTKCPIKDEIKMVKKLIVAIVKKDDKGIVSFEEP